MHKQSVEHSSEFKQFLQQVEVALLKSSTEARRLAEQTGTTFVIGENCEQKSCSPCSAVYGKQN